MSEAVITLEDHDGVVACKLTFTGGFTPESHAHQHAQILIRMMDELCVKQDVAQAEPVIEAPKLVLVEG